MNNNQPKKDVIGESKVLHVSRGFAIPMIIIFMSILIMFGLLWFGVLATDLVFDVAINPIIQHFDPDAEEIDIMETMNPPTSESQAAKVYASFPTLDTDGIKNAFKSAHDVAPNSPSIIIDEIVSLAEFTYSGVSSAWAESPEAAFEWVKAETPTRLSASREVIGGAANVGFAWISADLFGAVGQTFTIISDTIETYPAKLELWYNDHLPFRSLIFNASELSEHYIEIGYSDFQNKWAKRLISATNAYNVLIGEAVIGSPSLSDPNHPSGDTEDEFDNLFGSETESTEEETLETEETEETLPPLNGTEETETIPEFIDTEDTEESGVEGSTQKCEHELGESEILEQPTCTTWGIAGYRCQKCGKIVKREYTAKAPHTKNAGTIEKEPTCTEKGIMAYHCVDCGALVSREYINKISHSYEVMSNSFDTVWCGSNYTVVEKCSLCGNEKSKTQVKAHTEGKTIKTVSSSYTTYGYTLVECTECKGQYRKDIKNKKRSSEFQLPINRSKEVMEGRYQWLFYRLDNSQAYFEGTNLMTDAELKEYVAVMTTLNKLCKEKGITLQICIWPNKDQVYSEYVTWEPVTNEKRVDRLVEYVQENSDVKIIYPIKELKAAKPYFETYLKYDTHWNCAGGFVGYQAMLSSLGLETMDIKNVPIFEYTGGSALASDHYYTQIRGDLLGKGGWTATTADYPNHINYYIKYRPDVTVTSTTGGNGASDTRHTTAANAPNDCNFVMLADSYRVMQLGYLEKDFSDCFLTHRSHVNDADVKEAIKNADILVIAAVERYDYDTLNTAKAIIKILQEE